MKVAPLYIVDILGDVVQAVDAALFTTINEHIRYTYGRSIQILTMLQKLNGGVTNTTRASKYPLVALFQPFPEENGASGYYCTVKFPKIVIAMLTQLTDDPPARYQKNFKTTLYPIYVEFLNQLRFHKNIVINDPGAIPHTHADNPGVKPKSTDETASNFNDITDSIDIYNLQLTFKQVKPCKSLS